MLHQRNWILCTRSELALCPHTDVSVDKNAAPCTNGRFDGPHRSIRGGCWKAAMGRVRRSPRHGSSRAQSVYGGAERATWLARGVFTGEATWKPPQPMGLNLRLNIKGLRDSGLGQGWIPFGLRGIHLVDSTLARSHHRKPPWRGPFPDWAEHIDSKLENGLTKLPPLTYPLTIEEQRPEEYPLGRFRFPLIATVILLPAACCLLPAACCLLSWQCASV
ncbi:hypothetical protein ROA7023_04618 [Roseisalinus antarcticus]|uniref:Uncharacterized protein n=1 Tax=Roseisalinus antarcticus TaxID=254357 RepID=A0A1Y5U6A1_9RHOB|nr:hypothetical protein ROA7023_04618 [Roseisalinus antarcticus]